MTTSQPGGGSHQPGGAFGTGGSGGSVHSQGGSESFVTAPDGRPVTTGTQPRRPAAHIVEFVGRRGLATSGIERAHGWDAYAESSWRTIGFDHPGELGAAAGRDRA
ncbi:hypothetical protein [Nocardia wallacei]|uniref:hypothetical protein n=1 Tax=Nocardia wallacei TaxID=480035 RepID=UPI002456C277|nr:hypothetical protein [Nocardia wallacei]